jgi:DNA-binding NarL/FixJ family response regulator
MPEIGVLIVDDHAVVRHGIQSMLADDDQIRVVGEASNGAEALSQVDSLQPDVVLLDVRMPDANGIEVTRRLLANYPDLKIIILTNYEADEYLLQAIGAGAKGFLLKNILFDDLSKAIKAVHAGATLFDAAQVERASQLPAAEEEKPAASLSLEEKEWLRAIASGATLKDIAAQRYLGEAAARKMLHEIFRKLEVDEGDEVVAESRAENFRRRFDERHGPGSWERLVAMYREGKTLAEMADVYGGVSREAVRQWLDRGEATKQAEPAARAKPADIAVPESSGLSAREMEVLRIVSTGASNRNIAEALGISTSTVKIHLSNIYKKLGVSARTQAVVYTLRSEEQSGG